MPLTPEQIAKIRQKEADLPDALKRDSSVNYYEGWFFVTLNTRDEVPILSTCEGNPNIPDGEQGAPKCEYSKLGKGVIAAWKRNADIYDNVIADICEAMPEHFHGLIYLKPGNKKHLGNIIKGFMIGCSHAYWDILEIPWREMTYEKGVRTPQYEDRDHTRSLRGPALFVHGYNDMEPITPEEVEIKRAYIRDQARKRLIIAKNCACFAIKRHQHSRNWTIERTMNAVSIDRSFRYNQSRCLKAKQNVRARLNADDKGIALDYVGNKALIMAERKLPLVCHSRDAWQFEKQRESVLTAAREGAIIVSAFISEKEHKIKDQLIAEFLPFIEIVDNGFAERYKPVGKAFYTIAENRLVQISPWTFEYSKDGVDICREMCLVMNELARVISGASDDWWKDKI